MENLTWEDAGAGVGRLMISGDATVDLTSELRQVLIEGLERYEHLQIDCSRAESIDFYAVQLLCSAHRSSIARGKRLTFHGTPVGEVTETIGVLGFLRNEACALCPPDVRCLWV